MKTTVSVASKPVLKEYIITEQLNQEMLDTIYDYSLTLRVSESTKELYLQRLRMFGLWHIRTHYDLLEKGEDGETAVVL